MDPERSFEVDESVYRHMDLRPARRAAPSWTGRRAWARWREKFPEMAGDWDLAWRGRLREGWREALPRFGEREARHRARPAAQGDGGVRALRRRRCSAGPPTSSSPPHPLQGRRRVLASPRGRNIPFGIREHAMGAIVNGAAAHGGIVKPYGSTFLIFSDYMRPSVRLSALMGLPVVWVWTHDSVGLGEDGPTHQPVEQCASLRSIPDLWVIRPADANETAPAWRAALDAPTALWRCCSRARTSRSRDRDGVATRTGRSAAATCCGTPRPADTAPEIILIATGAEVGPTLTAARSSPPRGHACAWCRCRAWSCSKRRSRRPRAGPAVGHSRATRGRAGRERELVAVGRPRRRRARHRPLRRIGARHARAGGARLHGGGDRRAREGAARVPRPRVRRERAGENPRDRRSSNMSQAAEKNHSAGTRPPVHRQPSPLGRLSSLGQSVWVDFLSRARSTAESSRS